MLLLLERVPARALSFLLREGDSFRDLRLRKLCFLTCSSDVNGLAIHLQMKSRDRLRIRLYNLIAIGFQF